MERGEEEGEGSDSREEFLRVRSGERGGCFVALAECRAAAKCSRCLVSLLCFFLSFFDRGIDWLLFRGRSFARQRGDRH